MGAGAGQAVLEAERDATSTIFLGDAVRAAKEGEAGVPPNSQPWAAASWSCRWAAPLNLRITPKEIERPAGNRLHGPWLLYI